MVASGIFLNAKLGKFWLLVVSIHHMGSILVTISQ